MAKFEWKVEELKLIGMTREFGKFPIEYEMSNDEKKDFINEHKDGIIDKIRDLCEKYEAAIESGEIKKNKYTNKPNTNSFCAWVKKNKGDLHVVDYATDGWRTSTGDIYVGIGHVTLNIGFRSYGTSRDKRIYNMVEQSFHYLLCQLLEKEEKYFRDNDPESVLRSMVYDYHEKYGTDFGHRLVFTFSTETGHHIYIEDNGERRELTVEQLKTMVTAYKELEKSIDKIGRMFSVSWFDAKEI